MKKIVKSRLLAVSGTKIMVLKKVGKPIIYTLPGGVKKRKETEEEALVRETGEEITLKLIEEQVQFYLSHIKRTDTEIINKNYYYISLKPSKIKVLEKHKFETVLWLNWKKAVEFMDKSDRMATKAYFKNIGRKQKSKDNYERQVSPRIAL
ncbi:NUDIX hydrolase [Flagellimonas sp. S3867]|uniref:NUDIX hydrolase n=1 Tax=Flagellimonas sp. S3867 TaxID=2768063 RepID=UPI001683BEE0|nr:NUDIX hydrolase [Flagellimonas sp. S3867]